MAQHARRRTESFAPRGSVLDPSGFPHGMLVGFDPGGGRRGGHALLDLRAGGCAGRVVQSAAMRLALGDPATGFGLTATGFRLAFGGASASFGLTATGLGLAFGGTAPCFGFPASGFRFALGSAAPCFGFPTACLGFTLGGTASCFRLPPPIIGRRTAV